MSYNNSHEPAASLGGPLILLFVIVATATVAILSEGRSGHKERRVAVVLPSVDETR
ncbi:hypothetical protein LJR098_002406 [Rhizobium sp. LjRoot98]|uniref:hypothetical protein n=1 Tax=unclassified Rhizobium TaxID=2613769 RepID=UPI000AA94D99|nr:hypothetical protein [Rhizobium sp. Root1204]